MNPDTIITATPTPPGKSPPAPPTDAEWDVALIWAAMENASEHAAAFLDWLSDVKDAIQTTTPEGWPDRDWPRYAGREDLWGVPWLFGHGANNVINHLRAYVQQSLTFSRRTVAHQFDPAAATADPDAALDDLLVEIDYVIDLAGAFGRKYGEVTPDLEDRYRPAWAAEFVEDVRGVAWAAGMAVCCLRGDTTCVAHAAAWDRLAERLRRSQWPEFPESRGRRATAADSPTGAAESGPTA